MNTNETINRMKAMMTYGLQTESKKPYSSVEFQKLGADKKMYGIVREGTKYYVKVAPNKANLIKEDFEYIGGFRNRKNNEYSSYANALKQFDLKMMSIKESVNNRDIIAESWNPDAYAQLTVESTNKLRSEIDRQRQIMANASLISEGKSCNCENCDCGNDPDEIEKNNIGKATKAVKGQGAGGGAGKGAPFDKKPSKAAQNECMTESEQVLGWNDNEDYLDTSHGTEIGDGAPFDKAPNTETDMKNGVVEEGVAITDEDNNQNSPSVGTGNVETEDGDPFKKVVKEAVEDGEPTLDDEEDDDFDVEGDEDFEDDAEGDDFEDDIEGDGGFEDDVEGDTFEDEFDDEDPSTNYDDEDGFDGDIEARLSSLEDMISKIAEKLGVGEFDDDELYDDDTEGDDLEFEVEPDDEADDFEGDEDFEDDGFDAEDDFEDEGDSEDDDFEDEDDDEQVFESRSYRKARTLREDRMNYFGKHPAWRKKVMTLPGNNEPNNKDGYYLMDDEESVQNEKPYAEKIGDGAPFSVNPATIENAIAESIKRTLKKK